MGKKILRREFLIAAPAAAGVLSAARAAAGPFASMSRQQSRLGGAAYVPKPDYPRQPKRISEITLRDNFWRPKIRTNAEVTIPLEIRKFTDAGRPMSHNILEAAIYSLQTFPDAGLQGQVDARIREIRASQQGKPAAGNALFEVAAAYHAATGKTDLLDLARKSADLIYDTFVSENPPFSGGERDAINCIQLYRATREKKYLDLAKHYLDIRGADNSVNRSRHNQSWRPVLEQSEAVGHAVNAASLMVSLADVGVLTGIREYFEAARRIWLDVIGAKLYVTGGIGSTGNEGFGRPYVLPNLSAYCESCAAFMFATFNLKLFLATGDGSYIDVMERTMYNNAIDGVSASGDRFFYVNRLAKGVAGMLPAQSRPFPGVDARIRLRAGRGRDLCEPVCVQRYLLRHQRPETVAFGRKRNAVGRKVETGGVRRRRDPGKPQAPNSRVGPQSAGAGRPVFLPGPAGWTGAGFRQRQRGRRDR